jgi:hypothetical protein
MVMAKSTKQPKSTKLNKYWWVFALAIILVGFGSFFAYNKYLDQQNVNEMKELLSEFEQLKTTAEIETGKKLFVQADCDMGGEKFNEKYSCTLRLKTIDNNWSNDLSTFVTNYSAILSKNCELLSLRSVGFEESENHYLCRVVVLSGNTNKAEEIFYNYDTTPGRPF